MIRRAAGHDVDAIEQTHLELAIYERRNDSHLSHWISGVYPSRSMIRRACAKQEMYAFHEGRELRASMVFTRNQPEEYRHVNWKIHAFPKGVAVATMLCVPPRYFGYGYGMQMLHDAIKRAKRMRLRALRLDVWTGNTPAVALIERLGFVRVDTRMAKAYGEVESEQAYYELEISRPPKRRRPQGAGDKRPFSGKARSRTDSKRR